MPFSDNLYSAGDSDDESFSDELSPTNGYFASRLHPQDVMVPDPTTESRNAKTQEARAEAQANPESHVLNGITLSEMSTNSLPPFLGASSAMNNPTPRSTYEPRAFTSALTRQNDLYSEASPLLPPPAYSTTTSQSGDQPLNGNYSTISARLLEEGSREPESMGQPNGSNERVPVRARQVRRLSWWLSFRGFLLVALVLTLAVGLLMTAVNSNKLNRGKDRLPSKPPLSTPGPEHGPYCPSAHTHYPERLPTYQYTSGGALSVLQVSESIHRGSASVSTVGEIIIRKVPENEEDQKSGYITFDVWTSDPSLRYEFEMDAEMQALKVTTPKSADLASNEHHCISLQITVWVPPSATFKQLMIDSTQLSLRLLDDIDMNVSNTSMFATYAGNIYFPTTNISAFMKTPENGLNTNNDVIPFKNVGGFSSREIYVRTTSGNIDGAFVLWDLLHVESNSGNIHISITPKPPLEDDSKPAQLTLITTSGDIKARLPIWQASSIPERDYRTKINTNSGDIQADVVIGTESVIKSVSGSLVLIALPTTFEKCFFTTRTESGNADITVLSPLDEKGSYDYPSDDLTDIGNDDPYLIHHPRQNQNAHAAHLWRSKQSLTYLASKHEGSSGNVKMHYPSSWEGEINAENISGAIKVGGSGVRIIKDSRKNWAYHEVVARKGIGASSLRVQETSGDIEVWIG